MSVMAKIICAFVSLVMITLSAIQIANFAETKSFCNIIIAAGTYIGGVISVTMIFI